MNVPNRFSNDYHTKCTHVDFVHTKRKTENDKAKRRKLKKNTHWFDEFNKQDGIAEIFNNQVFVNSIQ